MKNLLTGYQLLSWRKNPLFVIVFLATCVIVQAVGGAPVFAGFFKAKLLPLITGVIENPLKVSVYVGLPFGLIAFLLIEAITIMTHGYDKKLSKKFAYLVFFIGWAGYMTGLDFPYNSFESLAAFKLSKGLGNYVLNLFLTGSLSGVLTFAIYNLSGLLYEMEAAELADPLSTLNAWNKLLKDYAIAQMEKLKSSYGLKIIKTGLQAEGLNQEAEKLLNKEEVPVLRRVS